MTADARRPRHRGSCRCGQLSRRRVRHRSGDVPRSLRRQRRRRRRGCCSLRAGDALARRLGAFVFLSSINADFATPTPRRLCRHQGGAQQSGQDRRARARARQDPGQRDRTGQHRHAQLLRASFARMAIPKRRANRTSRDIRSDGSGPPRKSPSWRCSSLPTARGWITGSIYRDRRRCRCHTALRRTRFVGVNWGSTQLSRLPDRRRRRSRSTNTPHPRASSGSIARAWPRSMDELVASLAGRAAGLCFRA